MAKVHWVAKEIGMGGESHDNDELVKITKEDRLRITPADMTGNELDFNERRVEKHQQLLEESTISFRPNLHSIDEVE